MGARSTCKCGRSIERRVKGRTKEKQAVERETGTQEKWWQVLEESVGIGTRCPLAEDTSARAELRGGGELT